MRTPAFISALLAPLLLSQCDTVAPASGGSAVREELPATGPVPQKVIDDCLAALRPQVGGKNMRVINSRRGETSFIVDVQVAGAEKPWRCFHDGTKCTGTEYQGEG